MTVLGTSNGEDLRLLEGALAKLKNYIEHEQYQGYDPYDTLNSKINFNSLGKWGPVLAIQFQKRNPINIRPLLSVKKDYNPKAIGLLLYGYSLLQKHYPRENYSTETSFLFQYLTDNYNKNFNGYCWGYNFDWASSRKYIKAFSPNIVVTAFIAKGILKYYEATKDEKALKVLESIGDFILKDLPQQESPEGICFSYTTQSVDCCYNASLLAASVLSKLYHLTKQKKYAEYAKRAVDFVISKQHPDGHWNYSLDLVSGKERKQIDFHQGYVIDSILDFIQYCEIADDKYFQTIKRGAYFYRREQFFETGQSKWRLPKIFPIDIHNQSQGIITFSKLSKLNPEYLSFANTIATWTIKNMQNESGYFYYRKLKYFTNKISYMRWSQAWMFVALTEFLTLSDKKKDTATQGNLIYK